KLACQTFPLDEFLTRTSAQLFGTRAGIGSGRDYGILLLGLSASWGGIQRHHHAAIQKSIEGEN
ncbi:MAG: hypothetical protein MRZ79_04060, partial [Bacteroidia bacterium]|nr:hypothetical protein [Bacteroidia bacterium]